MEENRTAAEWREMLLEYRLGELDEARTEQIDELLISDEEFASAMQGAEYDLLDAYAAHELSAADRLRVEQALEPQGRFSPVAPKLVIDAALGPEASLPEASAESVKLQPVIVMPVRPSKAMMPRRWLTVAAALLVGVGLPLALWMRAHNSRNAVAVQTSLQTNGQTGGDIQPPAAQSPSSSAVQHGEVPAAGSALPSTPVEHGASMAVILLPSTSRSLGALPVRIAPQTTQVKFQWLAIAASSTNKYELQVVTSDGKPECKSHGDVARTKSGESLVEFMCVAAGISTGDAFVRVYVAPASGDDAPLLEAAVAIEKTGH